MIIEVHVSEHHDTGEEEGGGVGQVLAGNVGGCAVDCLKDGAVCADVAAGGETQTTDETSAQVGEDVTIQIGHHQHIVLTRILTMTRLLLICRQESS